jgi:uncharacterized membrane protein
MTTNRLEAFSDGVIAVIITIMVLELHVPRQDGLAGLWSVMPKFAIYIMSFMMVGIYWINHHELLRRTEEVDQKILWANLVFLLTLSIIPFFVDYLDEKLFSPLAVVLYQIAMLLAGAAFLILRWSVMRRQQRVGQLERADEGELRKHWFSLGLYLIALPLAFYHQWLSLGINVLVTLLWIVPRIERTKQVQDEF